MKGGTKAPPQFASVPQMISAILILTLLVGNSTGSFAGRLARGLALAAAAGLQALGQIPGLQSLDSPHGTQLLSSAWICGIIVHDSIVMYYLPCFSVAAKRREKRLKSNMIAKTSMSRLSLYLYF